MKAYVLRRLGQAALTLVGVSVLVFVILRVLPGDPAKMLLPDGAPQSAVDELNRQLGLREPLHVQYGDLPSERLPGRLRPVLPVPRARAAGGRRAARRHRAARAGGHVPHGGGRRLARHRGRGAARHPLRLREHALAVLGQSLPNFWLGIMLILLFGVALRWLPTSGFESWRHLILPAVTLAAFPMALVARLTRSSMLEILGRDYIRTGRAKGLAERAVVLRHALRNAAVPVLTVLGLQIGTLLGGAVITESVFAWPGMGKLVVDAIFFRDFPVVQTVLILSATIFVVINLLVDLLYTVIDPRIRYS